MQQQIAQQTGWSNLAMLLATLLSGVIGSLATLIGNHFYMAWKDRKEKRERIFKTLMSTRGFRAYPAHVEALCAVEIEWSGKNDDGVRSAWRAYNHHLNKQVPDDVNHPVNVAWRNDTDELFAELIVALANSIRKPIDKTDVKRGSYGPKSWWEAEFETTLLRKGMLALLDGRIALPIGVKYEVAQAAPVQSQPQVDSGRTNKDGA